MPTYDYECKECGHEFEKFQPITASAIRKCPSCGKLKVRRLIGIGAGVIFKGSGFYQTDYRSESYRKDAAKAKEDSTPKTDAKDKKDTKSASPASDSSAKPAAASADGKSKASAGKGGKDG